MDWEELLELTIPRVIITILLLTYCIVTIPVISMHSVSCTQEGIDCTSTDYRVSIYYCLNITFHEEFHSFSMYSVRDCNKMDLFWLFIIIPLLYFISLPVHDQFMISIYVWKSGSNHEGLTFGLLTVTAVPALIFGIMEAGSPDVPLIAYTIYPFSLFYLCALMIYSGDIIIPGIMIAILAVITRTVMNLSKKWEIPHVNFYVIWVLYLVVTFLGIILMYISPL
ncbi:MAG: hypothetical protein HXS48_09565 [Theionarchaea archaeon]|nr:hypothetical protein [Theionarchaea archaeon]